MFVFDASLVILINFGITWCTSFFGYLSISWLSCPVLWQVTEIWSCLCCKAGQLLVKLNTFVLHQQEVWPLSHPLQAADETEPFCVVATESMTPQPVPVGCWWNWTFLCCVNKKYDPSASQSPLSQPLQAVDETEPFCVVSAESMTAQPAPVGCWWNWIFLCCVDRKYDPSTSPSRLLMKLKLSV